MSHAVAVLSNAQLSAQILADSTEALIMSLGLSIQIAADNGWQHASTVLYEQSVPRLRSVLSTHFLQLTQPAQFREQIRLPQAYHKTLTMLRRTLLDAAATVDVQVRQSARPQHPARQKARYHRLGPHLFRLRSDTVMTKPTKVPFARDSYEVTISVGSEAILTATGCAVPDVDSRWPVYLTHLQGVSETMLRSIGTWHVGSLMVTLGSVSQEQLQIADMWDRAYMCEGSDDDSYIQPEAAWSPAVNYASRLGHAVGRDIVASVTGE